MAQQETTDVVVARGDMLHSHTARRHNRAKRKSNIIHIYTKRAADTSVTPTHAKKKMTRHRENENRERNQKSKSTAAKKYDRERQGEKEQNQESKRRKRRSKSIQNKHCQITTNTGNTPHLDTTHPTPKPHDNNDVITTTPR